MPQATAILLNFNATNEEASKNNNKNFFDAAAFLFSQLPELEKNAGGYTYILPNPEAQPVPDLSHNESSSDGGNATEKFTSPMLFLWTGTVLDAPVEKVYEIFGPTFT